MPCCATRSRGTFPAAPRTGAFRQTSSASRKLGLAKIHRNYDLICRIATVSLSVESRLAVISVLTAKMSTGKRRSHTSRNAFSRPANATIWIRYVPPGARRRFFRLWTLKEAYIKARGLGMAIPLPQISFDLNATPRIAVSFAPGIEDDPEDWQFAQPEIPKPFVSAVALNVPSNEQLRVHLHEA